MTRRLVSTRLALALLTALLVLVPLAACGGADEPIPAPAAEDQAAAPSAGGDSATGAVGGSPIGPISSRSAATGAGIRWDWPDRWQLEAPANSMRMAQASIPGDGGPATLVVFHFGPGAGGGVDANIQRWVGQMEVDGEPQRQIFQVGGFQVTWIDVAGTLQPSGMGMGPTEPQPGSRLVGAVVEGDGGPWFFKATGPDSTLTAARPEIRALLDSLQPAT